MVASWRQQWWLAQSILVQLSYKLHRRMSGGRHHRYGAMLVIAIPFLSTPTCCPSPPTELCWWGPPPSEGSQWDFIESGTHAQQSPTPITTALVTLSTTLTYRLLDGGHFATKKAGPVVCDGGKFESRELEIYQYILSSLLLLPVNEDRIVASQSVQL